MSDPTADPDLPAALRRLAQERLADGIAPPSRGWGLSVESLALLHRLAGAPSTASDALTLLHELQVHQVELDLQQSQLETNEQELAGELDRYRTLFTRSPLAQFVLDGGGRVLECNRAGAELLGTSAGDVGGRRFGEFLSADSQLALAGLLRDVRGGATDPCRTVRPKRVPVDSQSWRLAAATLPPGDAIQLVVTDSTASPEG